ncbi:hypothetical protein ACLBOM_21995 [Escherichia coli]
MAALLLMVAWNMSEAHKVVDLLRHAPKDDIIVMLLCMSLTVLFDMVIAISVGIVLASLLFMRAASTGTTCLAPVVVDVPERRPGCALLARCFLLLLKACSRTWSHVLEKANGLVILKRDAVPVLDAGGLDAFQRFVKRLPEGCELRVCNVDLSHCALWLALAFNRSLYAARSSRIVARRWRIYKYEIDQSAQTDWSANCIIC